MSDTPSDRRYLESHEWHKQEADGTVTVGITQSAADELTDITYVGLPKVGDQVTAGQRFGEVESVKATSDLNTGISGTVFAINEELKNNPGLVNSDAFKGGWMIKIKPSNADEFNKLLSADDYEKIAGH